MIAYESIKLNIDLFKGLEKNLSELVEKYILLEKEASKISNEVLRKWYNLCNSNYAISRSRVSDYLSGSTIINKKLTDFQYRLQVGAVLMPTILNFVNSFEYVSTLLRMNSLCLSTELENIVKPQLNSLVSKWTETDKGIRESVITVIENSVQNTSKTRKALKNMKIIDDDDVTFLRFIWDIRNAMHNNFVNTRKISYQLKDKETGRTLDYTIEPGKGIQFWDTPKWNLVITEKLAEIMVKIISGLDDLPKQKSDLKDL